ncbi:hypothetical protein [Mesorhizobium sp. 113-1-2]|uniref:hypothetical protein n=1 Tax=Mesorhizobium sp. 113-1-2 TaxID=2744515 RepID=UPI0019269001|nr:hypothetical protein [Mesorhizobium sp. 113-1-2]
MTNVSSPAQFSERWSAAPEPGGPPAQTASPLWSGFCGQMGEAFHAGGNAPFAYSPAWEPGPASSSGTCDYQRAHAEVSDANSDVFDSWITTLASWTQAGTATIGQQGGPIETAALAANGDPLMRGGWN